MDGKKIRNIYLETDLSATAQNRIKTVFAKAEKYEEKHGVDLLTMTPAQLKQMVDSWELINLGSLRNDLYALKQYFRWAQSQRFCSTSAAEALSYRDIDLARAIRAHMFLDFASVIQSLSVIGTAQRGFAVFPIVVFAWMGVAIDEVKDIPRNAIDLKTGSISCNSQLTFSKMTTEMVNVMQAYDACMGDIRDNGIPVVPGKRSRFIYPMDYVNQYRSASKKEDIDPTSVCRKATAILYKHGDTRGVHYHDIVQSGKLYYAYQAEQDGIDWGDKENAGRLQKLLRAPEAYKGDAMIVYHAYKKAFDLK